MLSRFVLAILLVLQPVVFGYVLSQEGPTRQVIALAPESKRWHYENCTAPEDLIEIHDISISPDPPLRGEELTVTAKGYLKETLEEGMYADVLVKVGLIKILQKRFDVCEEARNANATLQCPVEPGEYTIVQTIELPKEIPPAAFKTSVKVYDVNDRDAMCVDIWIDFRPQHGDTGF